MSFPANVPRPDLARPATSYVPPRGDLPGRPDPPQRPDLGRRGRPRWIAPVAALSAVCLLAVAGLVVANVFKNGGAGSPGSAFASPDTSYAFLDTRTESGERVPVRWNPCEPLQYEVNPVGAPSDALDEIQRATARVSDATGITFTFDGTTDRTLATTRHDYFYSDAIHDTYYPVLFTWIPHERMVHLTKEHDVLAFTHPELGESIKSDQWVSGWIVLDAGGSFEPSGRYSLELVLTHELGHLMGLDHVAQPDELMFSSEVAPHTRPDQLFDWGPGDLAGLELLGHDRGCMDHIDVAP